MTAKKAPETGGRFSLKVFDLYLRAYFLRHFSGLRLSKAHGVPDIGANTVLYSNHPSWWDPIVMLLFAAGPLARFSVFAPIEAASLARYPILRRLGLFGIRTGSVEGARHFVAVSEDILRDPGNLLVTTAQGRFADVRSRPAGLRSGVAHLLKSAPERIAVPVALEYVFWNDRLPEALVAFGEPQRAVQAEPIAEATQRLDRALVGTQEALSAEAMTRDPDRFDVIVGGRHRDVSGVYGAFRRIVRSIRHLTAASAGSSASRS